MKHLKLLFAAIVALFAVACEQTAIEVVQPEVKLVEVAFEATTDETRIALDGNIATWEVGDKISVALVVSYYSMSYAEMEIRSASDISADGKKATFRGSIPTGSYYGVTALYPAQSINFNEATLDRGAIDNVFMSSYTSSNDNPVLTVTEGESVVVPISFSHLMHKMDFAITSENNDLNTNNIVVEISATSSGSPIEFVEKQTYNLRANSISVADSATSIFAYGTSANFSTMLFPFGTKTNVEFTFGVYIDGEKRYEVKKGPFSTFKMSAGKTTKVNLSLSDENSVTGGGEIVAEPITLSATKSTIKANGVDSATLSVATESGEVVTAQSTIYVNGSVLNGTTFLTTSAGSYTLYAERLGVRSNELVITAEEVTATGKTIVFAEGVTLTSGWYDVNKFGNGTQNGDVNMCWAAASSNMIQWWQDRYVAKGGTLPSTAINGEGTKDYGLNRKYELALMDMFYSEWDNSLQGPPTVEAIPWYFEGKNYGETASAGTQATPKTYGGYWSSVWSSIYPHLYHEYKYMFGWYTDLYVGEYSNNQAWDESWKDWNDSVTGDAAYAAFSARVVESIDRGIASLVIQPAGLSHAVTLWGYEIDNATQLVTRIWITDSDDLTKEPKTQLLNEYNLKAASGARYVEMYSTSGGYSDSKIISMCTLSAYGSAE